MTTWTITAAGRPVVVVIVNLHQVQIDGQLCVVDFLIVVAKNNRALDGVFQLAGKAVGPAQEGMGLGRGVEIQRLAVQGDGLVVVAVHLSVIGLMKSLKGLLAPGTFENVHQGR